MNFNTELKQRLQELKPKLEYYNAWTTASKKSFLNS